MEETEIDAPEQLFEYVTEDEYSRLVRERQADGFILDDGGYSSLFSALVSFHTGPSPTSLLFSFFDGCRTFSFRLFSLSFISSLFLPFLLVPLISHLISLFLLPFLPPLSPAPLDGSYSEHGREIFDEETDPVGGVGDKKRPPGGKAGASKVAKRVAKPGNIKAMVMGMGGGTKKRKEVRINECKIAKCNVYLASGHNVDGTCFLGCVGVSLVCSLVCSLVSIGFQYNNCTRNTHNLRGYISSVETHKISGYTISVALVPTLSRWKDTTYLQMS